MRTEGTSRAARLAMLGMISAAALRSIAQSPSDPLIIPDNDLVDPQRNEILVPGDRGPWERFNDKLDRLFLDGDGQVNIVQIGGSHIQADVWTAELRERLQRVAPGTRAGRGFIFPYNMAGSNNPYWYEPVYTGKWSAIKNTGRPDAGTLGLAGYAVTTHDSATSLRISFRGDMYPGYTFTRATVIYDPDSSFLVNADCTGGTSGVMARDDLQRGVSVFTFAEAQDTLFLSFERSDTLAQRKFTLYGILLETDDPGVYYHAVGVNGAATWSYLRCQLFTDQLALLKPDLVVFSIGINDAHDPNFSSDRYAANYRELIARVHQAAPDCAVLLVTNSDSYRKRRYPVRNAEEVRGTMMRLAREQGAAVWDLYGVMGGPGSIRRWQRRGLAKRDLVHFTREGYTLVGDLMFTALMRSYGDHVEALPRP